MEIMIEHGSWKALQHECERVRMMVFIAEQTVPKDLEWDGEDEKCEHFIARDKQKMILGCARLFPDGHIGRLAVLRPFRGRGVGRAILKAVLEYAKAQGIERAVLNAQTHARAFYEREGFKAVGDVFMEAGIEHIRMEKALN